MLSTQVSDNYRNYLKISEKIQKSNIPLSAGLEMTYACNLKCRHCYVVNNNKPELTTESYRRLIDDLHDLGTFCLVFTGGEPLLRKDLFEIAGYAKEKGFLIVLFTNGTLIDRKAADRVKECGFWLVEISLYGAGAETHDHVTQCPGSFEKTLSAIHRLQDRGVEVNLKTLLLNLNIAEYEAMQNLADSLSLNFRADIQVNPRLDGSKEPFRYGLSEDEIRFVLARRKDAGLFPCADDEYQNNLTCNAGKKILSIAPDGDVKPCVVFPARCGNILDTGIKEIWRADKGFLANLRKVEVSDLYECPDCKYHHHCVRCHAAAYLETGDMLKAPRNSCKVAVLRHEQDFNTKKEKRYGTV